MTIDACHARLIAASAYLFEQFRPVSALRQHPSIYAVVVDDGALQTITLGYAVPPARGIAILRLSRHNLARDCVGQARNR
ncbi:hypothetical protein GV829_02605 [Sphingomonas lacunae]|uniref:Uncharacterized protein n=1 Tax=Sphingomonas lacunae TaxID=2698828 RepID=A0A6M4ARZ2_9SPHN|nr:hypothetical protein [Sphingomonas lacunae]QJQ31476.1 hypothetical protein GV829_02605 [Sphingomonas lacunae]